MNYRFELENIDVKKGKMSREERSDVTRYLTELTIEADSGRKAFRQLAARVNGRLPRTVEEEENVMVLPDYAGCQIRLRAVREKET